MPGHYGDKTKKKKLTAKERLALLNKKKKTKNGKKRMA